MCGICGILTPDGQSRRPEFGRSVRRMASLMRLRGPDDEGYWSDADGSLRLGFRRLAVLDTTSAGRQPMVSADGDSVIVFNGEIYNFVELRRGLEAEGVCFRSRSDTEVLLEALNLWGTNAISRLNGMFAFAWYNRRNRSLVLARDHAGIKPLYYFVHPTGRGIAFASQFNALMHTPWGEPGAIRQDVLRLYLRLHHIPAPHALLENTWQLEPGSYAVIDGDGRLTAHSWWRLPVDPEPDLAGDDAVDAVEEALDDAVQRQRIADVPLGVFLSGGVDSPLVTAVGRRQSGSGLKAFTIGNPGWWQDEASDAAAYGKHLQVDHRIHQLNGKDALDALPHIIAAQYEPFADFSILPTLLLSQFARNDVVVALSGDGGDELFFGYERPLSLLRNGADFRWPHAVRLALYAAGKFKIGPRRSDVIVSRSPAEYYFGVNCRLSDSDLSQIAPDLPKLPSDFRLYEFPGYRGRRHLADYSRRVEFYGQLQRGLKKVDMASMHCSLEVRVPLLDRRVIDVSLRIDPLACMQGGVRKAILRRMLARHVPEAMIPKPKRGFAVPLGNWLRTDLRPAVEEMLAEGFPGLDGVFDQRGLSDYWEDHLTGRRDCKWGLWTLLSLFWWTRSARDSLVSAA